MNTPFMALESRPGGLPKVQGTVKCVKLFAEVTEG